MSIDELIKLRDTLIKLPEAEIRVQLAKLSPEDIKQYTDFLRKENERLAHTIALVEAENKILGSLVSIKRFQGEA